MVRAWRGLSRVQRLQPGREGVELVADRGNLAERLREALLGTAHPAVVPHHLAELTVVVVDRLGVDLEDAVVVVRRLRMRAVGQGASRRRAAAQGLQHQFAIALEVEPLAAAPRQPDEHAVVTLRGEFGLTVRQRGGLDRADLAVAAVAAQLELDADRVVLEGTQLVRSELTAREPGSTVQQTLRAEQISMGQMNQQSGSDSSAGKGHSGPHQDGSSSRNGQQAENENTGPDSERQGRRSARDSEAWLESIESNLTRSPSSRVTTGVTK